MPYPLPPFPFHLWITFCQPCRCRGRSRVLSDFLADAPGLAPVVRLVIQYRILVDHRCFFGLAIVRRACRGIFAGLFVGVLRCVITTSQKERQRGRLQQCSRSMFQDRNATKLQPDPFDLLFPSPSQKGPEADVLASSKKSSLETSKTSLASQRTQLQWLSKWG